MGSLGSLALFRPPVKEKKDSEIKLALLRLNMETEEKKPA